MARYAATTEVPAYVTREDITLSEFLLRDERLGQYLALPAPEKP